MSNKITFTFNKKTISYWMHEMHELTEYQLSTLSLILIKETQSRIKVKNKTPNDQNP